MLKITIPEVDAWDEINEVFVKTKGATLQLEHSLLSVSKWEAKWHEPFMNNKKMTRDKTIDYIKCMTLTSGVDPEVYNFIPQKVIEQVNSYIEDPMTATTIREDPNKHGKSIGGIVTSEQVYSWMISLNIPFECQKWHFNRLMTLIRVCNEMNKPAKKMPQKDLMNRNKSLNAARKAKNHTTG